MLPEKLIKSSKSKLDTLSESIQNASLHYYVCSDPSRLRILYLFKRHGELCPSDIHQVLGLSMSAISHQLKTLEQLDILSHVKMGKMVCYKLSRSGKKFIKSFINF